MWSPGLWGANGETGPLGTGFFFGFCSRTGEFLVNGISKKHNNKGLNAMLTASEVARLLNVHINTVRRWTNRRMLKTYRIGSRGDRRFDREDIASFLKHELDRVKVSRGKGALAIC